MSSSFGGTRPADRSLFVRVGGTEGFVKVGAAAAFPNAWCCRSRPLSGSGGRPKSWGEPVCRIAGGDAGDLVRNNLQQVIDTDKRVAELFA
jgi:hypothetical protein